jgi:putative transposase
MEASRFPWICAKAGTITATMTARPKKHHRWKTREGEKRTIAVEYKPSDSILKYLIDMREALREALTQAYVLARSDNNLLVPGPVALRRKVKPWFDCQYGTYAKHHVNPVCRTAVALLRSYRKKHRKLAVPEVSRLAMRIDSELFRVNENDGDGTATVRVTLKPFTYDYITFTPTHKRWSEYSSAGKVCELLLTESKLCMTFIMGADGRKPLGRRLAGSDLNFHSMDSSALSSDRLESPHIESLNRIVQVQNDFSRRRRRLQLHVKNPEKRARKLSETKDRQRNRVKDALHKLSTRIVRENPDTSFIFEDLQGIRGRGRNREKPGTSNRKLRTYLNRWPYRAFQRMVEYKSHWRTLYVSPRGTSSQCPVCGGRLKHPAWAMSRCRKCGVDYDRDRLASLAILQRGLRLCGQPFAVSAGASWQPMKHEYLYAPRERKVGRAGGTDQAANAPNRNVTLHEFPRF